MMLIFLLLVVAIIFALAFGYVWIFARARPVIRIVITALLLIVVFYSGSKALIIRNKWIDGIRCAANLRELSPSYHSHIRDNGSMLRDMDDLMAIYIPYETRSGAQHQFYCAVSSMTYVVLDCRILNRSLEADTPILWCPTAHNAYRSLGGRSPGVVGRWVEFTRRGRQFMEESVFRDLLKEHGIELDGSKAE